MTVKYDVTSAIDTAIDAMSTGTGYKNDYDNVNEFRQEEKTYPNVKSEYIEDEYLDADEQMVDSYTSNVKAMFKVEVDNTVTPTDLALSQVLEDFQRLLEAQHAALQIQGSIKGDLIKDEYFYTNIRKRPGFITMEWDLMIRVKRSDPDSTT